MEAGVLSEKQLRGPRVQRVVRGVYAPALVPLTHALRVEAVGLLLPPGAAVTGRSQATVLGVPLARARDEVEVLLPAPGRWTMPAGVRVRQACTVELESTWNGVPLVSAERMAFDVCSRTPKPEGVAGLDQLARGGLLDPVRFQQWLEDVHDPYVVPARAAATMCDPRAESPQESRVRVLCRDAGLDVVPAVEVRDAAGRFVARVDLALEEFRVAVEYDGAWHALREELERDRRRLRALRDAGWEVVHVTAETLREPGAVVDAVRRAVARQNRTA
ncbi:DUF559 domain-containing protein [Kineococcus arenarius]|uniref:DUF559 domain-containing protein n=1 Tax=Kineococcus sp. SYSU DK007 TaxID=3383128 RepID=UPI003D7E3FB5